MRRPMVAGLAVLALVGGLFLWNRASPGSERGTAPAPGSAAAEEPAAGPATAPPQEATIDVRGRIQDERGFCLTEEEGTMRLVIDGRGDPVEAAIADGEWSATVPSGTTLAFEEIRFGDRKAVAVPATMPLSGQGMDVRCRWLVPTLLRVIGETGEDLEAVELVGDTSPYGDLVPPDDKDRILTGGSSPVELASAEGVQTYWVRARDHAWARISVFVGFGGERVVRLVRAGALDVRLASYDPESSIEIHLLSRDETDLSRSADDAGRARIEGLAPGRYEVRAQNANWNAEVFAEAEAEIRPGATTELTLDLRDAPKPMELVPLAGTIEVAPGWLRGDGQWSDCMTHWISAWNLGGDFPDVKQDEDGRWSAGLVRPGRYCVCLGQWQWKQRVDVGPRGNIDVRLVVPPPCDVEVHLVDGQTGEPIATEGDLAWGAKSADTELELASYVETLDECDEPGLWRLRAPVGTLVIGLWSDLVEAEAIEVELRPGLNRVDLKAAWNLSVDLAFRDGGIPVPVDPMFGDRVEVAALDGDGELVCAGAGDACRIWVTKPGRYRVSFPAVIEGYEPIAPLEVEVAAGRIPRIEVQLSRRGR